MLRAVVRWAIRTGPRTAQGCCGRTHPVNTSGKWPVSASGPPKPMKIHSKKVLVFGWTFPDGMVQGYSFSHLNSQRSGSGPLPTTEATGCHKDSYFWSQNNLGVEHLDMAHLTTIYVTLISHISVFIIILKSTVN